MPHQKLLARFWICYRQKSQAMMTTADVTCYIGISVSIKTASIAKRALVIELTAASAGVVES